MLNDILSVDRLRHCLVLQMMMYCGPSQTLSHSSDDDVLWTIAVGVNISDVEFTNSPLF